MVPCRALTFDRKLIELRCDWSDMARWLRHERPDWRASCPDCSSSDCGAWRHLLWLTLSSAAMLNTKTTPKYL